jgi:hypothetical protein
MTCLSNGKKYVGQAVSHRYVTARGRYYEAGYEKRIEEHFKEAENGERGCYKLNGAIRKYGRENFKCKLIMSCPIQYLDYFERLFIDHYKTYSDGLNLNPGGFGGSHTDETLKRISDTNVRKADKQKLIDIGEDIERMCDAYIDDIFMNQILFVRLKLRTFGDVDYKFTYQTNAHQAYEDCFERAYNLAAEMVPADLIYISGRCMLNMGEVLDDYEFNKDHINKLKEQNETTTSHYPLMIESRYEKYKHLKIERLDIRLRKRQGMTKITVCIKDDKRPRLTECEFGGARTRIMDAYDAAIEFADMFGVEYTIYPDVINLVNQVCM